MNHPKANIKPPANLINLPTTVEELQRCGNTQMHFNKCPACREDNEDRQLSLEDQKKETLSLKKTGGVVNLR